MTNIQEAAKYLDPRTGETFPLETPIWRSPSGNPLLLTPLPGLKRNDIETGVRSIWRYRTALPVPVEFPISMGEGCTPMVESRFGDARCFFKLEWFAPTGSFKDRGSSVMLSLLRQQGISSVLEDSSGNGGSSIAGYGAAGDMHVKVLVPAATSPAKIVQMKAYGAEVELIPGPRDKTEAAAIEQSSQIFYASHNWHPFFLQGTKTLGYEIWEDFGFRLPDNIIIPTGAGSIVLGCYIAFQELLSAGEITHMPRLFVSQPANCAPLHASFQANAEDYVNCEIKPTVAEGTAIKRPIRMPELLGAIRDSQGGTVAIEENIIMDAAKTLARKGLYAEPSCAHAAAAFSQLTAEGIIQPSETTVVILTGTGLKTTAFYENS